MIVYFFKKSKSYYKSVLTGIFVFSIGLYGLYITKNREERIHSTIQIIRSNQSNSLKETLVEQTNEGNSQKEGFLFVASKRGVYYYPIKCSKAQALSVKNMLYFKDKLAAEAAGFKQYLGCFD